MGLSSTALAIQGCGGTTKCEDHSFLKICMRHRSMCESRVGFTWGLAAVYNGHRFQKARLSFEDRVYQISSDYSTVGYINT